MSESAIDMTAELGIEGYSPDPAVYDELRDQSGLLRPKWQPTFSALADLGSETITSRWQQGRREIARSGIAYNPHDEQGARTRPWQLDALPYLVNQEEWAELGEGLVQWAMLGDHVLSDLFGKQQLLKDKIVPPEFLYAHPKYQPAYHVAHLPDERRLHLCGSDMARSADGRWWTSGFRTRAPIGLGYLIENRVMESRLFPEVYHDPHVHRIAPFFVTLRDRLRSLAPVIGPNPRIVLWSPGPSSASYFEDAYLARYLNYTLALSGDLAVRQGRIMLKTLHGLLPIDVLFRRIDDDACDPTELDRRSNQGVSGLVEVMRGGQVGVLNGLGADLLESPILFAYAQSLCNTVFGKPLILPPVATWWCGEAKGLDYVLSHLDSLVIRPAFGRSDSEIALPGELDEVTKRTLIEGIKKDPTSYVGQERVRRSQTPVWREGKLEPWDLDLRGYCVGNDEGFESLCGGVATVSKPTNKPQFATRADRRVQDVWVFSEEPVNATTLLPPPGERIELQRRGSALPSRVCDNLYWLGRTLERIESLVRIQRVAYRVSAGDYASEFADTFLAHLYGTASAPAADGNTEATPLGSDQLKARSQQLLFEPDHPGGLQSLVSQAVTLASTVRDRIAMEMWRSIRNIEDKQAMLTNARYQGDTIILSRLDQLVAALSSFVGLVHESMTRTDDWTFLDLGRRIERAFQGCDLLGSILFNPLSNESTAIELLLEIGDSIMTYRGRYLSVVQVAPAIDLLLTDESNPRSIAYQLLSIYDHVRLVHQKTDTGVLAAEERLALAMLNAVRLADVYQLEETDRFGNRVRLSKHLERIKKQLTKLSEAVSERYFVHAGTPRHFGVIES